MLLGLGSIFLPFVMILLFQATVLYEARSRPRPVSSRQGRCTQRPTCVIILPVGY